MEHLQLAVPSMKRLYLDFEDELDFDQDCVDFLVLANTFIRKHKNLYIHFDVMFLGSAIESCWIFDSNTQLSLPLHTPYPGYIEEIDRAEQWCSVSGLTSFKARTFETPMSFLTNTETIPFIRAINSTVSRVQLKCFSPKYEIVLDGFRSLKQLSIRFSVLNKFPRLPESLRELEIEYVNDLTMSDMDHGITLPTRLCSLIWHGNLACFTLPKILNIDKLLYLKDVSVEISPFEYIDLVGEEGYDVDDYVTSEFLRVTNTCTIEQLQQFVSQLPSDLEILKINIYGCIRPNMDNYYAYCPDELSFKRFTNLNYLEFRCYSNDNPFNVSVFPAVTDLNFISHPVLTGCFAQGIRSLVVNLETYAESVSYFLSHFISKLTSLVDLFMDIHKTASADIRGVELPSKLCFFKIAFNLNYWCLNCEDPYYEDRKGCVILDTLPVQLSCLELDTVDGIQYDVIVDDCKGESISSIAKRIRFSKWLSHWIQYSHFDCDEESFGLESLYAS
ncbi:unnamed protein product [Ambrosiozyma monospora]|uniref:Unnamed protein product n=1 Tax=Ambrosiozyma monospora TaxID=43982 RepID=A0A9W6WEA6_AMBMO|nr:unnamed protein product [Ambrosiozyma monospora]